MTTVRLVYGWGINDADYPVQPVGEDGKRDVCPVYQCWKNMISRCCCSKTQEKYPTYIGCWVDECWRRFMAFRAWYLAQSPNPDEHLDKDFLGDGKLYSPETCCFIPQWLNKLFNDHGRVRGKWPQGIYYNKRDRKFMARIRRRGKLIHLGSFNTQEEASAAYLKAKAAYVEDFLTEFPQSTRVAAGVRRKMDELIEQEAVAVCLQ